MAEDIRIAYALPEKSLPKIAFVGCRLSLSATHLGSSGMRSIQRTALKFRQNKCQQAPSPLARNGGKTQYRAARMPLLASQAKANAQHHNSHPLSRGSLDWGKPFALELLWRILLSSQAIPGV